MCWPTLSRDSTCSSSSGSSTSGSKGQRVCTCGNCGVRFEVCLPHGVAAKAEALLQVAGVRLVTDSGNYADVLGAGGAMWSALEPLVLSGSISKAAVDLFTLLPLLLLHFVLLVHAAVVPAPVWPQQVWLRQHRRQQ